MKWQIRSFLLVTLGVIRDKVTKNRLYFKERKRGKTPGITKEGTRLLKNTKKQKDDAKKRRKQPTSFTPALQGKG
jgi:hypothetical protein